MSAASLKLDIARVGEVVAFTKLAGAAGNVNVNAIAQPLDSGTASMMLSDLAIAGLVHPSLKLTVAGDCTVIANDEFGRDGRSFLVLKVFPYYIGEVVESRLVVAS